jgi:hypothetical protein
MPKWIKPLFVFSALYDGILGIVFLAVPLRLYELAGVTPPNHVGYVQFPAALLLIFGLMFLAIARDPIGRRHLIPYGIMLKAAYCGVTSFHWFADDIPLMWKPFVVIDLLMGIAFVWAYLILHVARDD